MRRVKRSKTKYVVVNDGSESRLSEKGLSRRIRSEWFEGHELYRLAGAPEHRLPGALTLV